MDNGFIFPYRVAVANSYAGERQGRPERGSTVQADPGEDAGKSASCEPVGVMGRWWGHHQLGRTPIPPRKAAERDRDLTVPQTDTGGQVENTEVDGIPFVKELGKIAP